MSENIKTDLILKLKEIFRSDRSDLDFGIYRILNFKRKEIERFIEEDLVKQAEAEFSELVKANFEDQKAELEALKEEINRDFGEGTIDERGEVRRHHDAPKIKSYIELKQSIDDQRQVQTQINDVFNHVYEFFSRYYDKGDFISHRLFGGREKYVIPHKGEEVSLHWVNQDQHYIKTTEDYRKYSFNLDNYYITFKLVEAESGKNNNVGADSFFVIHRELPVLFDEENKRLDVFFERRPLTEEDLEFYEIGKTSRQNTKFDTIIEKDYQIILNSLRDFPDLTTKIKSSKHNDGEKSELKHHLIQYCRKNDMDYFIHKRLGEFLRRELDFYIKNEVLDLDETISKDSKNIKLTQLKIGAIKKISEKIITFLDQIERFQRKLFEKKKFVLKTDYCMTLDLIPEKFYKEIGENDEQVAEWKKLFRLDEITKGSLYSTKGKEKLDVDFLKSHKFLVVDTKFFAREFKYILMGCFDNLDKNIEGLAIKSENWQALSLLREQYGEKVKCIYIDPPYNTGSDEFLYKDNYQHSSWLTLMKDRLDISRDFLAQDGSIYVHIDHNENSRLRLLMDQIFGKDLFVNEIIWQKIRTTKAQTSGFGNIHDTIFLYSKSVNPYFENQYGKFSDEYIKSHYKKEPESGRYYRTVSFLQKGQGPPRRFGDVVLEPPRGRHWIWSQERIDKAMKDGLIRFTSSGRPEKIQYLDEMEGDVIADIWTDIYPINSQAKESLGFPTQKPEALIKRIIESSSSQGDIIMDFFLGSGTTTAIAHKLKRKWIGIEMGDYFDNYAINRLKKVLAEEKTEKVNQIDRKFTGCFKYQTLEQFEDTLNNILFSNKGGFAQTTLHKLPDYFLQHVLDVETKDSPTRLTVDKFKTPFDYKIKTLQGREEKTEPVDLVETFNYLLGIRVKKIRQYENEQTKYIIVYGEKGEEPACTKVLIIWRNYDEKILEKEKQFIEQKIIPEYNPDIIYVNVDSLIKGAESIEPTFKELMGA